MTTYINPSKTCNLCNCSIDDEFVDGRTLGGPWAFMCMDCYDERGMGLGTGLGQKYQRAADGKFHKIEG